jgi:Fe-S cluster assembly protein SufD
MKHAELAIDDLRSAVRSLPDNGLASAREAALTHLAEHGLPTLRDEDWKYTDLSAAVEISNRWLRSRTSATTGSSLDERAAALVSNIDANWLVITNGVVADQFVQQLDDSGLEVSRLSAVTKSLAHQRPLSDLNVALLQDGLRIHIAGDGNKPLGILFLDQADEDAGVAQSCVELEFAPGSTAEVIEYHVSAGDADHYANSVVTMNIGTNCNVRHVRLQNRRIGHVHTSRTSIALGRDSTLTMAGFDLGGGLVRNDVDIDLSQTGAAVTFDGLYLAGDAQHIDNHTRVDHRVGPATSSQEYRGILNGKCRCVWNGKAVVHEGADGTDASQANHNLLLTEKAEVDAKPELEIYAEDVKCSHGTTVGQLEESSIFYLRTRGLSEQHAKQVLTFAFAADIVSRAPVAAFRETVSAAVESRLAELISADITMEIAG